MSIATGLTEPLPRITFWRTKKMLLQCQVAAAEIEKIKELIKIDTCMFYSLCQFNTVNLEGVVHKWRISLRNSFKFTPFPSFLFNIKPHDPFLNYSRTYYPVTSSLPSTCIFLSFKIHIIYEPIKPHPFCNALYKGTFFTVWIKAHLNCNTVWWWF